jgi:hypothetical protein
MVREGWCVRSSPQATDRDMGCTRWRDAGTIEVKISGNTGGIERRIEATETRRKR